MKPADEHDKANVKVAMEELSKGTKALQQLDGRWFVSRTGQTLVGKWSKPTCPIPGGNIYGQYLIKRFFSIH